MGDSNNGNIYRRLYRALVLFALRNGRFSIGDTMANAKHVTSVAWDTVIRELQRERDRLTVVARFASESPSQLDSEPWKAGEVIYARRAVIVHAIEALQAAWEIV